MRLDYQIDELVNNYPSENGYKYDHIRWEVWISNQELLDIVNSKFNLNLKIDIFNEVTKEIAQQIKTYCWEVKKYVGTYGTKYNNDMVKQLFDKKS